MEATTIKLFHAMRFNATRARRIETASTALEKCSPNSDSFKRHSETIYKRKQSAANDRYFEVLDATQSETPQRKYAELKPNRFLNLITKSIS